MSFESQNRQFLAKSVTSVPVQSPFGFSFISSHQASLPTSGAQPMISVLLPRTTNKTVSLNSRFIVFSPIFHTARDGHPVSPYYATNTLGGGFCTQQVMRHPDGTSDVSAIHERMTTPLGVISGARPVVQQDRLRSC